MSSPHSRPRRAAAQKAAMALKGQKPSAAKDTATAVKVPQKKQSKRKGGNATAIAPQSGQQRLKRPASTQSVNSNERELGLKKPRRKQLLDDDDVVEFGREIQSLGERYTDKHRLVRELVHENESLRSEVTAQNDEIKQHDVKLQNQKEKLQEQAERIHDQDEKLQEQEGKLHNQEEKLQSQKEKILEEKGRIHDQESKLADQESKLLDQQSKLCDQEKKLLVQDEKLRDQESKLVVDGKSCHEWREEHRSLKIERDHAYRRLGEHFSDGHLVWTDIRVPWRHVCVTNVVVFVGQDLEIPDEIDSLPETASASSLAAEMIEVCKDQPRIKPIWVATRHILRRLMRDVFSEETRVWKGKAGQYLVGLARCFTDEVAKDPTNGHDYAIAKFKLAHTLIPTLQIDEAGVNCIVSEIMDDLGAFIKENGEQEARNNLREIIHQAIHVHTIILRCKPLTRFVELSERLDLVENGEIRYNMKWMELWNALDGKYPQEMQRVIFAASPLLEMFGGVHGHDGTFDRPGVVMGAGVFTDMKGSWMNGKPPPPPPPMSDKERRAWFWDPETERPYIPDPSERF